ncbi:ADP-ribose pyrophosphatase [Patulibacter medicamentivorans]|uniref:ADP-ribose pyrophosphatase n=1 Tax=Patulibacter medicamentivorans TaxID=1097667 RepID=H0E2L1_9ACTN|nr:NUDIX hydrolase [Patulibacter medicamentivorans]EHN12085.1 ADP-ribose pyrophosphatase [Patulibacter medicamentivorans]
MSVPEDRPRIRTVSTRVAYRNPWMVLREDAIERPGPDGVPRPGIYAVVEKPHSAVVVPWDGVHLHLVGQDRYPLGRWSWELPQGAAHAPDGASSSIDDHAEIARAELREETGFEAGTLTRIGDLAFAPGMANQTFTAWLATDLRPGPPQPEAEEEGLLVQRAVTPEQFDAMVDDGEVVDAASIATWHLARRHGLA